MQKLLVRVFPWQIKWKGILTEAIIFLAIYILWLIFHSPASQASGLIGCLAILAPLTATVYLIFRSLPAVPDYSRRSWSFLGLALICILLGSFVRTFYLALLKEPLPALSAADIFNLLAYPLILYALMGYPFENRYAPSRLRFFLDATITSGVVLTLGLLVLSPATLQSNSGGLAGLVPMAYPILDLVLLMILVNMLLASRKARRTSVLWSTCLLAISFSDFNYGIQMSVHGFRAGTPASLGWTVGFLLFGLCVLIEREIPATQKKSSQASRLDFGPRLQNLLPVILVLALFVYVLLNWQSTGEVSQLGLWMSLVLAIGLIVRMGIRAGESELQKYWQLFSSLADPVFICDARGRIILGNPALMRALGKNDESQISGELLETIFELFDLSSDLLQKASRQTYTQEVTLHPQHTPYKLSLSRIVSEGRRPLFAGVTHDLTEQKRHEDEIQKAFKELQTVHRTLEELNTQLEEKVEERTRTLSEANRQLEEQNKILQALDQLKSDFVSMVSHELRTPLTSLNGGLELLLNRRNRRANDRTTLLLMKNEVERLTRLVENILNLSAIEAGRMVLHPVPLSIQKVLVDVCKKLSTLPGGERIHVSISEELPMVLAEREALESILNHLIDNALKYAPSGLVEIKACKEGRKIRVEVTDTGPGIPKEKRRLLFRRFQRLDPKDSQSVYGFGLGLYLSRRILQTMSSDLAFEEPAEGGARFYFYLKETE